MEELTKRESEVVDRIICGLSNNEIALDLGIRLGTVKHHLLAIGDKMGIDSERYALRTRIAYLMAPYWSCPLFRIGAGSEDHPD